MNRLFASVCCLALLCFGGNAHAQSAEPVSGVTVYSLNDALPPGIANRAPQPGAAPMIGQPMVLSPVQTQHYSNYEPEVVQGALPQGQYAPQYSSQYAPVAAPVQGPRMAVIMDDEEAQGPVAVAPQVLMQPQLQPQPAPQASYSPATPGLQDPIAAMGGGMAVPPQGANGGSGVVSGVISGGVYVPADAPASAYAALDAAPVSASGLPSSSGVAPVAAASYVPMVQANAGAVSHPVDGADHGQRVSVEQAGVSAPLSDAGDARGAAAVDLPYSSQPAVACTGNRSGAGADYDPSEFAASMTQKMALLEAEKEKLRQRLGTAEDLRSISQCVSQDKQIAELEAQVAFLKDQNASLKKAQDEAVAAATAAMEQMASSEARGGALSMPALPPLDRPDLPEADANGKTAE